MRYSSFILGRTLRNVKTLLTHPVWILKNRIPPDSHIYKRKRILSIARHYNCDTFIETGTFYGQMVNAVRFQFVKVLSVELFLSLYDNNRSSFSNDSNVHIYYGDSSTELRKMLKESTGRVLFWLDGHYSGAGTACGEMASPIISELELIRAHPTNNHCILIDDARLFTGEDGYPKLDETKEKLLSINPAYHISIDHDCILALP